MLLFQDQVPGNVGPVRSARYYFIGWAAESHAAYAHVGGSPQALRTLRTQGGGQLVYDVDGIAWSPDYFWRVSSRAAPHNLYTNGARLRQMASRVGAGSLADVPAPAWTFGDEAPLAERPTGGSIDASYFANHIRYTYDRATNTYPRWVSPGVKQVDAASGKRVAPRNVVVMFVRFGRLANDPHPEKLRLEAEFVGSGRAYVATNGRTISARWVKSVAHRADAIPRREGPTDRADARPDVHPGHADRLARHDHARQGAATSPAVDHGPPSPGGLGFRPA